MGALELVDLVAASFLAGWWIRRLWHADQDARRQSAIDLDGRWRRSIRH